MIILNGSHKTIQFIEQGLKKVTRFTQNVIKAGERGATLRSIMFMQFRKNEFSIVIIRQSQSKARFWVSNLNYMWCMLNCGKTISYCFSCIVVLLILRALLLYFNKSITARQKCFTFLFDDDSTVPSM